MLSARLQSLIDKLSNPNVLARVRLVRETKAVYEAEYPTAAKGAAQAAGGNRAKGVAVESKVTPFAEWLSGQLKLSVPSVEKLIARARYVSEEALQDIEARGAVKGVGGLLDRIVYMRRKDPNADWRLVIESHTSPVKIEDAKKLHLRDDWAFMSRDVRSQLEGTPRRLFDAIVTDPPYGMSHLGKVNGIMTDDKKGARWAVPLMAKWVRPGGSICVWCNRGTLGRWTEALLDAGLVVAQLVHRDKGEYLAGEMMLVASLGHPDTRDPTLRVLSVSTLPNNASERAVHDTPKPLGLMAPIIEKFTRPNDWVFDPFAGTGVIGEAALRAGRRYFGAEIDPRVADYAVARLNQVDRELRTLRAA